MSLIWRPAHDVHAGTATIFINAGAGGGELCGAAHAAGPAGELDALFTQPLGAFVTLSQRGNLRGCIGYPEAVYPLYETIMRSGMSAALHDPRFSPVTPGELADLHIEISVLSPLRQATPEEVEVGTHGLVIERGHYRGLLLPQVPVEWGWNREEFLEDTCRKAGLPADAWREGATLYTFTAEVFSEQ